MNLPEILEKLLPWVLKNGFSEHSLSDLAKPLGLTRGAFCYYFSAEGGGLKADIGRQLLYHARGIRQRFLSYPVSGYTGPILERRAFFAEQMFHYLEKSFQKFDFKTWSCPAFILENELRMIEIEKDKAYHALLEELFCGPSEYLIMDLKGEQLEKVVSGPFLPSKDAVYTFFKVPVKN